MVTYRSNVDSTVMIVMQGCELHLVGLTVGYTCRLKRVRYAFLPYRSPLICLGCFQYAAMEVGVSQPRVVPVDI